jgi:hypothetical protein
MWAKEHELGVKSQIVRGTQSRNKEYERTVLQEGQKVIEARVNFEGLLEPNRRIPTTKKTIEAYLMH